MALYGKPQKTHRESFLKKSKVDVNVNKRILSIKVP